MDAITFSEPDRALMRKLDTAARALLALGVRRATRSASGPLLVTKPS